MTLLIQRYAVRFFATLAFVALVVGSPTLALALKADLEPCTASSGSGICRTTITGACQLVASDPTCMSGRCCITNPNPPAADGSPCSSIRGSGECKKTWTTACDLFPADPTCESGWCCITELNTGKFDGQACSVREGTGTCNESAVGCSLSIGDPTCQSGRCCVTTVTQAPQVPNTITCKANGIPTTAPDWTLVRCGFDCNNDGAIKNVTSGPGFVTGADREECTYLTLVDVTQSILNFLLYFLAAPIAALMFLYAGFLLLTNRGNEAQVTKAKSIFTSVFWGLVVALAAWLIITFLLDFFVGGTVGDTTGFRPLL